jgi:hypothetical protein
MSTAQLSIILPQILGKEINFTVLSIFLPKDTISSEKLEITKL